MVVGMIIIQQQSRYSGCLSLSLYDVDQAAVYYSQQNRQPQHHHHPDQQQQQQQQSASGNDARKLTWKKEIRAAKWFCVVLAVFALCWLPLHIMNTVALFAGRSVNLPAVVVAILLSHANSAVNPVLYAYSNAKFAAAFRRLLRLPQRPGSSSAAGHTLSGTV